MPPLYAQDPLAAVERGAAWSWLDLPVALAEVAGEGWVVALIALALFAWLEREVKDVMKAFLPLVLALAAAGAVAAFARLVGAVPRPVGGAGWGVAPFLGRAFPSGQAGAVAAFAAYALLAYGWRARGALLLAVAVATARVTSGAHWAAEFAGGGFAGAALGAAAYATAVKLFPRGHLARLRAGRRSVPGALADRPSA